MPLEAPEVRVRRVELRVAACPTTEAVRFGADELRSVPVLTARVSAEIDGEPVDGYAAEPLLATWYESPGTGSSEELLAALAASARDAGWAFEGAGQGTLFELWVRARAEHVERDGKGLVQGFGIALVERAAMDAVCRARGFAFLNALRWNLLGFQPDLLAPELEGWNVSTSVQAVPPKRARARQTIRIDDALTSGPSSLTALIARYGVDAFEVELTGSPEQDLARLAELAAVLEDESGQAGKSLPVRVTTALTEVGTVELSCIAAEGAARRWKLELQLRGQQGREVAAQKVTQLHPRFAEATELIKAVFGKSSAKAEGAKPVKTLRAGLEKRIGIFMPWSMPIPL